MSRNSFKKPVVRPTWRTRLAGGLLALLLIPALASAQSTEDKAQRVRERNSQFNLASAPTAVLRVNQYQCGLVNDGSTCTDVFDSPTGGGGFWPTGSPNQYMFNSGLQVVGIIPIADGCTTANKVGGTSPTCFTWSGDTTGAFFMDAAGTRQHGTAVTDIFDSLNPEDLDNWPTAGRFPNFPNASAMVEDTALFNDVLIGRKAASQQDTWVMYWDGDPTKTGGRTHPMGILVEQRTLAWNYPVGNENIIYFIYKFTNVTNNPLFQSINEARYAIPLPDAGWRIDSIYVAYDADPDVTGDYDLNYATAILPANLGVAYKSTFVDPDFIYPPALFSPPFFKNSPGFGVAQYLKSPIDPATGEEVGLTSFSLHTNGGAFPDPSTVARGWRYISLNVDAGKGDPNCTFSPAEVQERRSCYLPQTTADVRYFIGSGPFSLEPGASATIAVAQYAAAVVNQPGSIVPGEDNKPGFPSRTPGCHGVDIRPIEYAAGLISTIDCTEVSDDETTDIFNLRTVPNSVLGRAQVAQSIFDNEFLLGFAPESPPFYLVPGHNQVTILWQDSPTEQEGDPFFAATSDPTNPLFNPNYREFDVEGYRIYRGTSPANLELIAQYDKDGSVFTDFLCVTDPTFITADRDLTVPGFNCPEVHEVDISSPFVQYITVAQLANGDPIVLAADTALSAQIAAGTGLELTNTGIPYAYVDKDVRNGFQYFYRVTAFDINSQGSGLTSLESAGANKTAVPVAASPNLALAAFQSALVGVSGEPLDPEGPIPGINAQDGTFSGPMPPTNSIEAAFAPLVERLLPQLSLEARIDSVLPRYGAAGSAACPNGVAAQLNTCWDMYLTVTRDGVATQFVQNGYTNAWSAFGGPTTTSYELLSTRIEADATSAADFGIPAGFAGFNATVQADFYQHLFYSAHIGQTSGRSGSGITTLGKLAGGSRWFSGANETTPDPARFHRVGHLEGVDTIMNPQLRGPLSAAGGTNNVSSCFGYSVSSLARAADVEVRWGASGAPEVWDVTHDVPVIFKPSIQSSFGFLMSDANGNGVIDWADFMSIPGLRESGFCAPSATVVQLEDTPRLVPVSTGSTTASGLTQTGMGFGMYLNGEHYIFQLSALPGGGTVWTHRSYSGLVTASGHDTENPSGYAFISRPRPPMVPGLRVTFTVDAATTIQAVENLARVHVVPDPYYATSLFDLSPGTKELQFVNLPPEATIRIYSLSGVLVDVVNHSDLAGGSVAKWNLRNRSNQFVGSGVYLFHASTPDGKSTVGKFTVINSGFAR